MKSGLIIINAYVTAKHFINQAERLAEEFATLGADVSIVRNNRFFVTVENGKTVCNIPPCDFIVYLDKDKYMSVMLEAVGFRLFNSAAAIAVCDDKMSTHIALANKNIPMPKTIAGLMCYSREAQVSAETIDYVANCLGFPLVVKLCYGSLGDGVSLAKDRDELIKKMDEVKCAPHLFQQFVASSIGRDVRAIVIGGKVVCAMERVSCSDFRSNIGLGGVGAPYEPPMAFVSVCEKAADVLKLDYCGVDIMFGEGGEPLLCEVNSNAFFDGIERATHTNVARAYAEYILKSI